MEPTFAYAVSNYRQLAILAAEAKAAHDLAINQAILASREGSDAKRLSDAKVRTNREALALALANIEADAARYMVERMLPPRAER